MKKTILYLTAVSALMGVAAASYAQAGASAHQTIIYGGQPLDLIGAHATSWGGGTASDHDGDAFTTAGHAVHIETAGLYQGGAITLDSPVSLGDLKSDPTRYLQIIFSADRSSTYSGMTASQYSYPARQGASSYNYGGGGQANNTATNEDPHFKFIPGSFQIAQAPMRFNSAPVPQMGMNGMPPGMMGRGPGMSGMPNAALPAADDTSGLPNLAISQIHVILVFADGSETEMLRPINLSPGDDVTWLRAGIPLSAIPLSGPEASSAQLKKILIGTDVPASLNIGEIRLVNDTTAITADAGKSETVPAGSTVTLVGTGEGGASALKYEWDFDSPDTFLVQGEGVKVTHAFYKPGDYTVTLKVSDEDGIKQPATSTVVIHVNDQGNVQGGMQNPASFGAPGGPPPGYGPPKNFGEH